MGGGGSAVVTSGEEVADALSCWSTLASRPQCCLSVTVAGGGVDAEAESIVTAGGCGWEATSPIRPRCCPTVSAVRGGELVGGEAMPMRDGDRISSSGSHSWMPSWLRIASASSVSWGLDTPPSWVGAIGGGRGVPSSWLGWSFVADAWVCACCVGVCAGAWVCVCACVGMCACVWVWVRVRACVDMCVDIVRGCSAVGWVMTPPSDPGGRASVGEAKF